MSIPSPNGSDPARGQQVRLYVPGRGPLYVNPAVSLDENLPGTPGDMATVTIGHLGGAPVRIIADVNFWRRLWPYAEGAQTRLELAAEYPVRGGQ